MAYAASATTGGSFADPSNPGPRTNESVFDIFEWYPKYQSCQKYFLDHAQHSEPVQAVAAFINITLPCNRYPVPMSSFATLNSPHASGPSSSSMAPARAGPPVNSISLIPYLRRLVALGMDIPGVLHGFFGDDWRKGIGPLHEQERRNYLFAAKSGGWAAVKKDYDMGPDQTIPFLRPLQNVNDAEIEAAEKKWSEWLAMEDWMVGSRTPAS